MGNSKGFEEVYLVAGICVKPVFAKAWITVVTRKVLNHSKYLNQRTVFRRQKTLPLLTDFKC